jgi:hypothetical protein
MQRLSTHPLRLDNFKPDNLAVLQHVRDVIKETDVPSWLDSVPREWGSAAVGTPKADEWRTMATVYFPIALITIWGKEGTDAESRHRLQLLDLTMCIVQATWLTCRRSTNEVDQSAYLKCLCTYLFNLKTVVKDADFRPNHHIVLHIYEFLSLWGPVYSWWCFPFERINGMLQRIRTSNVFGKLHHSPTTPQPHGLQGNWRSQFPLFLPNVQTSGAGFSASQFLKKCKILANYLMRHWTLLVGSIHHRLMVHILTRST